MIFEKLNYRNLCRVGNMEKKKDRQTSVKDWTEGQTPGVEIMHS